jgi:hypothetical protein
MARLSDPPVGPRLFEKLVAPDDRAWATAPLDVKAFSHALLFLAERRALERPVLPGSRQAELELLGRMAQLVLASPRPLRTLHP